MRARLGLLTVAFVAALLLTGCTQEDASPRAGDVADAAAETPDFQGAWADWFSRIYAAESTNDRQRAVLADGVIDDQEYVALRNDFRQCLEDLGVPVTLDPDGGFSVGTDGNLSETQITGDAVPACESETVGAVASLYESIRRNPDQKDEFSIVVDCLKNHGVVGDAYTEAQYASDLDGLTGMDWGSAAVRECSRDPLGILESGPATPGS